MAICGVCSAASTPRLGATAGDNPILMLGQVPQASLEKAASDPRLLALYKKACERLDSYMDASTAAQSEKLIAYFSMEYGLAECLPGSPGGLGVLSGDHLKASSDLDLPLVGVGLLYQKGYLRQSLNQDGWQIEKSPENDFYTLPIQPVHRADGSDLVVSVQMPTGEVFVKASVIRVGRVKLYLLDTNIPQNTAPENRNITDQLYGGDSHTRIRQEIVLGIGGMRVLSALGLAPTVFHMNEGHSAFLGIERIRLEVAENGLSFDEAVEAVRANNVFTTHTPVPAGIDPVRLRAAALLLCRLLRARPASLTKSFAAWAPEPARRRRSVFDGDSRHQDELLAQRRLGAAWRCLPRDVAGPVAPVASRRSAHHLGHQRHPRLHLAQRRPRQRL
jgi:starch phosphorylase